jgi:hypothetical protein
MAKSAAKFPSEIGVVTKAAGKCYLADGLDLVQDSATPQETPRVIQANRLYDLTAGNVPRRKKLL